MRQFNSLVLVCIITFLTSCSESDLLVPQEEVTPTAGARYIDDPIDQILGMDVHIKQRAGDIADVPMFLTGDASNGSVYLSAFDKDNGRQKWIISEYRNSSGAIPVNVIRMKQPDSENRDYLVNNILNGGDSKPVLIERTPIFDVPRSWVFATSNKNSCYRIYQRSMPQYHLNAYQYNSNVVNLSQGIYSDFNYVDWEITPAEEFEIKSISYDKLSSDVVIPQDISVRIKWLENNTDMTAERTITFEETLTSKSTFSETEGIKTSVKSETKVGIPLFEDGDIVNGTTTESSWSYTVGEEKTGGYNISEAVKQTLPPHTSIKATLFATQYTADLTYTVKLLGLTSGKNLTLQGKWNGLVVKEERIILSEPDGTFIRSIPVQRD